MQFATCPRLKKYTEATGEYSFDSIKLFMIGEGDMFTRALRIFLPEAKIELVPREQANIMLSVSSIYSAQNEYCFFRINENGIDIHCRDNAGARNAAAIIAQLINKKKEGGYSLPCGTLEDWPDSQYRAVMLESSGRSWLPMNRIRDYIYEMALCRMNVLQFHFMEGNGCTIKLDSVPGFPGFGPDNLQYTKDEVRDMIAYAAELGITVTPLVEVLSHAADLATCLDIACPGDNPENLFDVCLGQEKTFDAIEKVLAEIAELFPDDVLHIGADEYDMSAVLPYTAHWDKCPHCQALSKKMGFTTLRELFLYGIERTNKIVNNLGKVMMMWNADLQPGCLPEELDRNIIVHYYRYCSDLGKEKVYNLNINGYPEEGFSTINSYYPQTYMDFDYYVSSEKLCSWTPHGDPLVKAANRAKIPGGAICAWDEHEHYLRSIPAAILLFADRLWNAYGDPVVYDDKYGKVMTRVLFEKKLPEDMNVFDCFGDVLPPLKEKVPAELDRITISIDEMKNTATALRALAKDGNETAGYYADAIEKAIEERSNRKVDDAPQKERKFFVG